MHDQRRVYRSALTTSIWFIQRPLQQPPDRLRARGLRVRLAFDPGVELGVQLGGDADAGMRRDPRAGTARRSFLFLGY